MATVNDIIDMKQRLAASQAKLSAAVQEGRRRVVHNPVVANAIILSPYVLDEMMGRLTALTSMTQLDTEEDAGEDRA